MRKAENELEMSQTKIVSRKGGHIGMVYALPSNLGKDPTCLIIAHGAGGPMYSPFISFFHEGLAEKGYLTVKFNFAYMEARRRVPDKREILEDNYRQVIEEVRSSNYQPRRVFVGGKSMGGRIASQAVALGENVDGLFFLGYPLHPPGRPETLRDEHLYKIDRPMLFISGTKDQFAKRELLDKVVSKLDSRAEISWIEEGDHSFNTGHGKEALIKTYGETIETLDFWVKKHTQRGPV